jgi:glycosyltransferase involved in cell wall biosynthesis
MESLKIAMFSWETLHSINVGGMARAVSELSRALAKEGHEVHVFTRLGGGQGDYDLREGVNYHRCGFDTSGDILWHCEKMCNAMTERFYSTEQIVGKFDVVHAHDWHSINAGNHLKLRSSYPFVLTFHSTEWGRNGGSFGEWYEFREISGREWYGTFAADRIITVSNTMKNELMWLYQAPAWKVDVIPNGIDPGRFYKSVDPGSVKKRYGIHPLAPTILFIGRLAHQKGPDILMGAIPSVLKNRWDARVLFAGDGGMSGHLSYLSNLFGVPGSVKIMGYVPQDEYLQLLNACDIVCIPSRNEPFGLVLLEAWSAKRAVVASDVGGLSENIDNFKNGIKVYPTSESLAWGINYVINDWDGLKKLGERGYERVKKKFSWRVIARSTVESYKQVI